MPEWISEAGVLAILAYLTGQGALKSVKYVREKRNGNGRRGEQCRALCAEHESSLRVLKSRFDSFEKRMDRFEEKLDRALERK